MCIIIRTCAIRVTNVLTIKEILSSVNRNIDYRTCTVFLDDDDDNNNRSVYREREKKTPRNAYMYRLRVKHFKNKTVRRNVATRYFTRCFPPEKPLSSVLCTDDAIRTWCKYRNRTYLCRACFVYIHTRRLVPSFIVINCVYFRTI